MFLHLQHTHIYWFNQTVMLIFLQLLYQDCITSFSSTVFLSFSLQSFSLSFCLSTVFHCHDYYLYLWWKYFILKGLIYEISSIIFSLKYSGWFKGRGVLLTKKEEDSSVNAHKIIIVYSTWIIKTNLLNCVLQQSNSKLSLI